MSLFKLKSLWTKSFPGEEFDQRHLAIGTVDRSPAIALANFQGSLIIFQILKQQELVVSTIYQNKFEIPIIATQFVSHPDERIRANTVGILFFRKFTFLSLQQKDNHSYQTKTLSIEVEPSFGIGINPLSVMTLNSSIQSLNPRQIQPIKVADPIYAFTGILSKIYYMDGEELVQLDGSTQQWRIIVGRTRQLFAFMDTVVVIGERALWEVSQAKVIKTKLFEEQISCGTISFRNNNNYNILVSNFSGQLFVYSQNYQLLWAIKLDYVPIKINVCQHSDFKGMLIMLSDQGALQLGYSGVEMPDHVVQPLSQKIDYAIVQSETRQFLERINNKTEQHVKKTQIKNHDQGSYKLYFGKLQKSFENHENKNRLFQIQSKLVKFQLTCQVNSRENLRNFKVQLNLPYNIHCEDPIKQLKIAKSKDTINFSLYASSQCYPYQRQINLIVRYENNEQKGPPFIKNQNLEIPMALQCYITGYQSKQNFPNKIIIKSNLQLPSFNDIFPELFPSGSPEQRKSLKFTLSNGVECVIGYNKGFNKAKIESPYYSGLCYIISQFSNHIRQYNSNNRTKIELTVQIPLEQFFTIMKQHYQHRIVLKKAFDEVELKSEQFRSTQKKLLLKMKQKMTNFGSIDKLLDFTYERLIESANQYQEITKQMDIINHNLSVAITLIIQLLFIRSNPSQNAKNKALGILGYEKESLQRGWQDKVLANSAHFLNKKYTKSDQVSFEQLQKIPLYVISKVNNGDWN